MTDGSVSAPPPRNVTASSGRSMWHAVVCPMWRPGSKCRPDSSSESARGRPGTS